MNELMLKIILGTVTVDDFLESYDNYIRLTDTLELHEDVLKRFGITLRYTDTQRTTLYILRGDKENVLIDSTNDGSYEIRIMNRKK
jgi:hypothetical protein